MNIDHGMAERFSAFVNERHRVYELRDLGLPGPWTNDPVLRGHKFTNVFRAIDYVSQFLIRELLYGEDRGQISHRDILMRAFLLRYNNRAEPWEFFHVMHGRYPVHQDLSSGLLQDTWGTYNANGAPIFGSAFKMFVGQENKGMTRLGWVLGLTEAHFTPDSTVDVVPTLARTSSVEDRVAVLRTIPRCAGFMSMQVATDIGYSEFARGDENEFVVAGPGAKRGTAHVAPGEDPVEVIRWAQEVVWASPGCPTLPLADGTLYRPSLLDIQNCFCEFGKYVRYLGKEPEYRIFRPAHPQGLPTLVLPEHWRGTGQ